MDKVPVQSLIDHIKTATDVDPWAKDMAERLLRKQIPVSTDLGKVSRGLECCWQPGGERTVKCNCSDGCPYMAAGDIFGATCRAALNHDTLDLIRSQAEEIKRLRLQLDEAMLWR